MDHQIIMKDYLLTPKKDPLAKDTREYLGGFLFAEMRTGKTLGTILALIENRKSPILIICPCNALQNWYNWLLAQGFKEDKVSVVFGSQKKRSGELSKDRPIVICNYQMSIKYKLKNLKKWRAIVFDESYMLSGVTAQITQYWIRGGIPDYQLRVAVTGDPAPENPLNFATQYFIVWGSFMGYNSYMHYYKDNWRKCEYSGKHIPLSITHCDKIRDYVQETAHCVTMDSLNLGSKFLYNACYFEINSAQKKIMVEVEKLRTEAKMFKGIDPLENPHMLKARAMERAVAGGMHPETHIIINNSKQKHIIEYYEENKEPIVVLSTLKSPLFEFVRLCREKGLGIGLIHGTSGTPEEKEQVKDSFLSGEIGIIAGQTDAVCMNYDFSRASKTFYITNGYKRNPRSQSEKRTTNVGKKSPVEIIDMCYNDTLDELIVEKLRDKGELSYSFIDMAFDSLGK